MADLRVRSSFAASWSRTTGRVRRALERGRFRAPEPRNTSTGCRSQPARARGPPGDLLRRDRGRSGRARPRARPDKNRHRGGLPGRALRPRTTPPRSCATATSPCPASSRENVRELAEARLASTTSRVGAPHAHDGRSCAPRLRLACAAHPGRQRRAGLGDDDHPQRDHASDAIIKVPSNDPLTALAIARTMADMAPGSSADAAPRGGLLEGRRPRVEKQLYQPHNIEKIVAWGGFASVNHVTRYIQPGLELISLDPKCSATIIGPEAFASDASCARWRGAPPSTSASQPGRLRLRARSLRAAARTRRARAANRSPRHLRGARSRYPAHEHEADDVRSRAARHLERRARPRTGTA